LTTVENLKSASRLTHIENLRNFNCSYSLLHYRISENCRMV